MTDGCNSPPLEGGWLIIRPLTVIETANMSTHKNTADLLLSEDELDLLSDFLISDATSDETMMLDCLDGFLTAIATSPAMPPSSVWMPKVWGPSAKDEPSFESYAQMEQITGLIMRHLSSLIVSLRENPDGCEPIFDSAVYPDNPHEFVDGEMWAYGYMTAVNLQRDDWQPAFDDGACAELLRPIYLLGTEELPPEQEALVETPEQREELSTQIPHSVAGLYRFWTPSRRTVADPAVARAMPKVGRNEKCPCGSGRKYKKCCGAALEPQ